MKRFVRGDIDGFLALGLDNLLMFILMTFFCRVLLQMPDDLFYGQILPATAIGLVIGNVYYARQAHKVAARENRDDVCALPYGISVITLFAFTFLVMLPARNIALDRGATSEEAALIAWQVGLAACLGNGLVEVFGSFVIERIRQMLPRAALLAAIGGIGLAFVGMDFVFRTYAYPIVGLSTLAIALVFYFGRIRLKLGIPPGLLLVAVGLALSWLTHWLGGSDIVPVGTVLPEQVGFKFPLPVFGDIVQAITNIGPYMGIIVTMGLVNVVLSMQNVESAEAAGDRYDAKSSLLFNGIGSCGAGIFGSPYPATIYVGHPGWKAIGSRAGYSTLNAVVISIIAYTGTLSYISYVFPVEAGMAIVIWSGVVMCAQSFEKTPRRHAAAVVFGLIPALAAFCALLVKRTIRAMGDGGVPEDLMDRFAATGDLYAEGLFALEAGYIYTSIFLAAGSVWIIERRFKRAGIIFLAAAGCSALGLMHSYEVMPSDVVTTLRPAMLFAGGYLLVALVCFLVPFISTYKEDEEPHRDVDDMVDEDLLDDQAAMD